jgi:hypothetical protein
MTQNQNTSFKLKTLASAARLLEAGRVAGITRKRRRVAMRGRKVV